jgi:NAD(P)-dependent dehydrogenase (short-subunit alcohol dehydrogenase family)
MNRIRYSCQRFIWLVIVLTTSLPLVAMAEINPDAPTVLITGTNRGIGLEFTRQYAALGWNVIATCRRPADADELTELAGKYSNITIEQIDVLRHDMIDAVAKKYKKQPIDVLLNNAGFFGDPLQLRGSFFPSSTMIYSNCMLKPMR